MLRDTPCLRGKVKDPRARTTGQTLLHKVFAGGHITIAGANSPASLASRPIRIVCCDEVDRYPQSAGAEGDPVNLAFKRATTFWNRKRIITSTPTIKGASRIEAAYDQSDQRRYFLPCPHCDSMQVLYWRFVKWPEKDPSSAYYECSSCRRPIQDTDKLEMLKRGVWVPENPGGPVAGFHINEIYSPWVTWPEMAQAFLEAKKLPETLKTWINTSLGETWEQEGESVDDGTLYGRREEYPCEVPEQVIVLTAGVDVQDDRLEVEVVGWGLNEESWGIEYRTLIGNPALPEVWNEIDAFLGKVYTHESGVPLRIVCALIDSGGHHTKQVYSFCSARASRWIFACKGMAGAGHPLAGRPTKVRPNGMLFHVGVDTAKELLFSRLRIDSFGPGYCHFPRRPEFDAEFFRQITAEKLTTKFRNGFPVKLWIKTRARNEALDCRVYAMAALDARHVDWVKAAAAIQKQAETIHRIPEPEQVIVGALPQPKQVPAARAVRRNNWVNQW
jgi:phage terminase large subunit GpA-like protein